jgi:hypothetical protein
VILMFLCDLCDVCDGDDFLVFGGILCVMGVLVGYDVGFGNFDVYCGFVGVFKILCIFRLERADII